MNSSLEICPGRRLAPSFHISTSTRTSCMHVVMRGKSGRDEGLSHRHAHVLYADVV